MVVFSVLTGVERVDRSLKREIPRFNKGVEAVSQEVIVEKVFVAKETQANNAHYGRFLKELFENINLEKISHRKLKNKLSQTKTVIRTGEVTPYSKVILQLEVEF